MGPALFVIDPLLFLVAFITSYFYRNAIGHREPELQRVAGQLAESPS